MKGESGSKGAFWCRRNGGDRGKEMKRKERKSKRGGERDFGEIRKRGGDCGGGAKERKMKFGYSWHMRVGTDFGWMGRYFSFFFEFFSVFWSGYGFVFYDILNFNLR